MHVLEEACQAVDSEAPLVSARQLLALPTDLLFRVVCTRLVVAALGRLRPLLVMTFLLPSAPVAHWHSLLLSVLQSWLGPVQL